jgi:hypothetical protein
MLTTQTLARSYSDPYSRLNVIQWPQDFTLVLRDPVSLCWLVNLRCGLDREPLDIFPMDNDQANLESHLIDLLVDCRHSTHEMDPWYAASILAVYTCTYKLSTGI